MKGRAKSLGKLRKTKNKASPKEVTQEKNNNQTSNTKTRKKKDK
jgi:hypothetical protein